MAAGPRTRWPDLAVLELLVAVETTGSLSEAARQVGVDQPNASRSVRRFEKELGLALVASDTRGSRLTEEGALLVEWARAVLDPARALMLAVDGLRSDASGRLALGASRTVAEYVVPAWLATLRREHPEVTATLTVDNSAEICQLVADGQCDLGVVESPRLSGRLRSATVASDRLVVVVAPGHPWVRRRRPLTVEELAGTPLVVREEGSGTRATYERAMAGHRLATPALELPSNEAIRITVASGGGPAVLSRLAVSSALATGQLVEVAVPDLDLRRRFRAVWQQSRRLTGPAADLVRIARTSSGVAAVTRPHAPKESRELS